MFKNEIDYDALWNEIENELDTDVAIDEFQDISTVFPSNHYRDIRYPYPKKQHPYPDHVDKFFDPTYFIFFPHRRHFY